MRRRPLLTQRHQFLGDARMQGHGGVEVRLGRSHLERDRRHLHDLRRVGAEDMAAHHLVACAVDQQLQDHVLVAPRQRVLERPEARPIDVQLGMALAGDMLGQPDGADLGRENTVDQVGLTLQRLLPNTVSAKA